MHNIDLILTLSASFTAALAFGYFTQRLGLSPIVGYLFAGILLGPFTPGFVADIGLAEQLAEIGVILLMFGVGLQFHFHELLAVRRVAIPGAIAQISAATLLGVGIAYLFDWGLSAGIVFGIALSVASTVVLIRVLSDNRQLHTPTGHIAVGWLVVEDIFTVLALVLLPGLVGSGSDVGDIVSTLAITSAKVGALILFTAVVGTRVIPFILNGVALTRSRELFTLAVLAIALGIAVGSTTVFGVSMALGAFLAGMVVGQSEFSLRAATEALPMRDAFAVLFFVSVGMLLDPELIVETPLLILLTFAVVVIGKPLAAIVIVRLLGYPLHVSLAVAVALAQIGEFSFILASLGRELKLFGPHATNAIVAAAILSIVLNPILFRTIGPIERWIVRQPRLRALLDAPRERAESEKDGAIPLGLFDYRAIVVGYGPSGQILTRLLQENDIVPTVIELNVETVRKLREQGIAATHGDATRIDTLDDAGIHQARYLILASASMGKSDEVIRLAREMNPTVHVLARTNFLREIQGLKNLGADKVFAAEGEVALALTVEILQELGATAEQIDIERQRVQSELFSRFVETEPVPAV